MGNISGSYNLFRLGLVAITELFVITHEESTLPESVEEQSRSSRSGGPRRVYGCKDEMASNYTRFVSHKQSLCIYESSVLTMTPIAPITTLLTTTVVRDLKYGSEGNDVRTLQTILINQGYSIPAGVTGYFFSQTQSALAKYQAANGIAPAIGYVGPITRMQMKNANLSGLWW